MRKALTKVHLKKFKNILLAEKENIINNSRLTNPDLATSPDDRPDEADLASSDTDKSMSARLGNRDKLYLKKIIQALQRINDGIYGECLGCEAPIGVGRLDVRPTAELCIVCKEEEEKQENLSAHGSQHKSLGRSLQKF